jgi:hypothetical protein
MPELQHQDLETCQGWPPFPSHLPNKIPITFLGGDVSFNLLPRCLWRLGTLLTLTRLIVAPTPQFLHWIEQILTSILALSHFSNASTNHVQIITKAPLFYTPAYNRTISTVSTPLSFHHSSYAPVTLCLRAFCGCTDALSLYAGQ